MRNGKERQDDRTGKRKRKGRKWMERGKGKDSKIKRVNVTFPVKVISKEKPAEKTLTQLVSHCQRALLLWSVYKSHTDKHRVHIYHAQCHIPAENESQQHHTMLTCPEKRGIKTHHVLIFAHYLNCHSWTLVKRTHGRGGIISAGNRQTEKRGKGLNSCFIIFQ